MDHRQWLNVEIPVLLHLHKSHSGHQDEQREPLVETQLFPQHGDRKQSRGEYFQLVCDLCRGKTTYRTTVSEHTVV